MDEHSITALLDWVDLVKMSVSELETVLQKRLELEREYEHVSTELKKVNRSHAVELDKKIVGLIELYKDDLEIHSARLTL